MLIGIKDTNDNLVAVTLTALSDLVPILGAATVIGGKRLKLFNDGRPAATVTRRISNHTEPVRQTVPSDRTELELPERLSPDGGEDDTQTQESNIVIPEEDLDSWSDWDQEENTQQSLQELQPEINLSEFEHSTITLSDKVSSRSEIVTDILTLDIKSQKNSKVDAEQEFNFFLDMEPVIEKANKIFIEDKENVPETESSNINLSVAETEENLVNEDCWGDDLSWVKN